MKRFLALPIVLVLTSGVAPASQGKTVTGKVVVVDDHGKRVSAPTDVWVYLESTTPASKPGKKTREEIRQIHRQFDPHVVVVPTGATIAFPNKDTENHNVFSPNRELPFDLETQKPSESPSRKFDDKGDYDIYCDRHKDMWAKVKVVDTDRIVHVTDGTFHFDDVPAGSYKAIAWTPFSTEVVARVTIADDNVDAGELHLHPGVAPTKHPRKNGEEYGPY